MDFVTKSIILIVSGTVLLRVSGRKSISQMTIAQTIIMISIGSLIVQPIAEKSIRNTVFIATIFIIYIIIIEYLQIKFNSVEKLVSGKAFIVIKDGNIIIDNLKKLRLTVDMLEMRLRQLGISKISDVKTATLEPNGQLGYELMPSAKPVTMSDIENLLRTLNIPQAPPPPPTPTKQKTNIFEEIDNTANNSNTNKKLK